MHQLVPPVILRAAGERNGSFHAVCLFVDTAGFTPLTTALVERDPSGGAEGTETIAHILGLVFRPLVYAVYAWGGFIAGFAGDSFKAVFPGSDQETYGRCLLAAAAIRRHMAEHPFVETRFGRFDFAVKVCMADGAVEWSIWRGEPDAESAGDGGQTAAYTFAGEALARCLALDAAVAGGEVGLTGAVRRRLGAWATTAAAGRAWLLQAVAPELEAAAAQGAPASQPIAASGAGDAPADEAAMRAFMPEAVLRLTVAGEFRQVVTLFVNLREVPDGAAGAALQGALFRLLRRHGGYLCRIGQIGERDPGATLLLFWGAPSSFEHDLARALDFALDLARETAAIAGAPILRAGVTRRLAYAGFVGADIREEYTCHGAAVNLAARLMVSAAWGEILLDEAGAREAGGSFLCQPRGALRLKGFAAEQPIFSLAGRRRWPAPTAARPLVGRADELARLARILAPLARGRSAGLAAVVGEAGIGKSRLIHELREAGHGQWFVCPADRVAGQSLHPFRAFLRHYFAQSLDQTAEENRALFDYGIAALLAATPDPALADELERASSLLAALVDLHWPDSLYARLDPRMRFDNTLAALKTLFKAESLRQPVIIQLEDAHWIDDDSVNCIRYLLRNIESYPIAILATTRAEADWARGAPAVVLRPLTAANLAQLAADRLAAPVSPALVGLLVERAEGNPFFAEQLLLFLQDHDLFTLTPAGLEPAQAEAILPDTVRALLTARLDRLPADVRQVIQAAAVLGREFDATLLTAMLDDPALDARIATAAQAGIWRLVRQQRYSFSHDLLRDAAYDMQLRARQRELHRLAAAAIERHFADRSLPAGSLAYHYERALDDERACFYLDLAGDRARDAYENGAALDYYRRLTALRRRHYGEDPHAPSAQRLIDALLKQTAVLEHTAAWSEGRALAGEALDLAAAQALPAAAAAARSWLGALWRPGGDYPRALDYLNQALGFYQGGDDRDHLVQTLNRIGLTYKDQGAYEQALACYLQALELSRAGGMKAGEAQALNNLGFIHWSRSEYEQALGYYEQALALSRQLGDKAQTGKILSNMGLLYWHWSRPDEALAQYQQALMIGREVGNRADVAIYLGNIGLLYAERCDYERAQGYYRQALEIDRELGNRTGVARHLGNSGLLYGNQGLFDEALAHHREALEIDRELGSQNNVARHLGNIAELHRHKGEYGAALGYYEESIPLLREMGAKYYLSWQLIQKAEVLFLCGDYQGARALNDEGLALALVAGDPSDVLYGRVLTARLLVVDGAADAAIRDLEALAAASDDEAHRAMYLHELWRIRGDEPTRQEALALYRSVYARLPNVQDGQRLAELEAGAPQAVRQP